MNKLDRRAVILRAATLAKSCTFGVTGVKIELEAVFGRRDTPEPERIYHDECGQEGCEDCHWDGYVFAEGQHNWHSTEYCQQWLLEYLSRYELAERVDGQWIAKRPLVFAYCYPDISVDTELTATLSIANPEDIFLLPRIVEAWNAMGEAIGNGTNVKNAGMHMALLNDPECFYSPNHTPNTERNTQFRNFRKSMQLLLPALYFLGSNNEKARSLHFREPCVEVGKKYSAIHYVGGALEFRVFDTCYDNPEAVLDNFVVMRNCIRYWQNEYRNPGLDKVAREIFFGNDRGDDLSRFYATHSHVDMLNAGLRKLKPSYFTIKQLKEQRKFTISKRSLNGMLSLQRKQAMAAYREYESRFTWSMMIRRNRYKADLLEQQLYDSPSMEGVDLGEATSNVEERVEALIAAEQRRKQQPEAYVQEKITEYVNKQRGDFRLRAA